MFISMQT